jgi:hypothetical protein
MINVINQINATNVGQIRLRRNYFCFLRVIDSKIAAAAS